METPEAVLSQRGRAKGQKAMGTSGSPETVTSQKEKKFFLRESGAALQQAPREAVGSLSMAISKTCLDKALSNLI